MKKKTILVLILLMCTGCFLNKWSFKINKDYHIDRESVDDIYLYKGKEKVLDKYVSHYAVMENYIYLETMRDYNSNVVLLYYLVDMDTNEVFGPYTTHTIMEAMGERGLILEDTIDTTVRRQNGNREED